MLRPARTFDALRLVDLLEAKHAESRFAGLVGVDVTHTRKLIAQLIQRHGGRTDGSALVNVVEVDGQIEAFMIGLLGRVYHIGDMLVADDMFLVATERAPKTAMNRLMEAYFQWADAIPRVAEVRLSHTDVLPSSERMGKIYERKGFVRCGAVYRRDRAAIEAEREAA